MRRTAPLLGAALLAGSWAWPAALAQTQPMLSYEQPLTRPAVRDVQDRLRQQGSYTGPVDGTWGAESQAALERFQRSHGLQITGRLNQATATMLGLNPPDLLAAAPSGPAGTALGPDSVRILQSRLRQLGAYGGPADGVWGGETQSALERYQQGHQLQATGQPNPATLSALGLDPASVLGPSAR